MSEDPKDEDYWKEQLEALCAHLDAGGMVRDWVKNQIQIACERDPEYQEEQRKILEGDPSIQKPLGLIQANLERIPNRQADQAIYMREYFHVTNTNPERNYPPLRPIARTPMNTIRPGPGQRQPTGRKRK